MLLVACAVSARTTLVACGDSHVCSGFYPTDAMQNQDVVTQDVQACFGFCTEAGPFEAGVTDADAEANADASDGDAADE